MGRKLEVPMPVASTTRDVLQAHMGFGAEQGGDYLAKDFTTLLEHRGPISRGEAGIRERRGLGRAGSAKEIGGAPPFCLRGRSETGR